MKRKTWVHLLAVLGLTLALGSIATVPERRTLAQDTVAPGAMSPQADVGTAFTYQGRLAQSGVPVTGACNFQFSLWNADSGGAQVGTTQTQTGVAVDKGYFTVTLDFGTNAFDGEARYLAISVDCGGGYTALTPRVTLTPAPYALALPGLRTQQNVTSPNLIGGYAGNSVTGVTYGATIGGGGNSQYPNSVTANYGTVAGGVGNAAASYGAVIGGGVNNSAGNYAATIAGGENNTANGLNAAIAGGFGNTASGSRAAIGGGEMNTASGNHSYAAGYQAQAIHTGAFVWADAIGANFASTADNQFAVRANGGVVFSTGSAAVQVNGNSVWHAGNDGSGSGLDADLLDGQHGSAFRDASNINAGALGAAYYSAYADLSAEGYLDNNASDDLLTRSQSDGRYWMLGGNTLAADGVLGASSNHALDVRVNNARALRLEPNAASPNLIGGYSGNSVTPGAAGATIGGGGASGIINWVTDDYGTVGGGNGNGAGDNAGTTSDRRYATVGGGMGNYATGAYSFIGGGTSNQTSGNSATVAGGAGNNASNTEATVAGGASNTASGYAATVGGGVSNTASGSYSFAAGYRAKATYDGAFVWADATSADFNSTAGNQFAVRANGGVIFSTGSAAVTVNGATVWHAGNDGSGSGLDADLLDGYHAGNDSGQVPLSNGTLNANLNADLLDGLHGSSYQDASNINAGTLGAAYYSAYADLSAEGYLDNNASGDLLTRGQSDGRYWMLGGNTLAADGVLGTANNYALDVRVNSARVLRLEPNATSPNLIGGYRDNWVYSGVHGGTIGGGGGAGSAWVNRVTDAYGTVGGGYGNQAGNNTGTPFDASYAFVGGGMANTASHNWATVGGGANNGASGEYSAVTGGQLNFASASQTFIGGGVGNQATVDRAAVVGGYYNTASANVAAVGGGANNTASGDYSAIPGGSGNTAAGEFSLAAGRRARADSQGCFVWGDSTYADITCSTTDQTIFRSSGGFTIYTNSGLSSGMYLAAGGSAWNTVSDRARKENFTPVDTAALLERLGQIEISAWNYRTQDPAIRHVGLMADDFNGLLEGLGGEGADHINSLDADGVALAASQGLYRLTQEQAARLAQLERENAALQAENRGQQAQLDALLARVEALEAGRSASPAPQNLSWLNAWPGLLAVVGAVGAWAWRRRSVA